MTSILTYFGFKISLLVGNITNYKKVFSTSQYYRILVRTYNQRKHLMIRSAKDSSYVDPAQEEKIWSSWSSETELQLELTKFTISTKLNLLSVLAE